MIDVRTGKDLKELAVLSEPMLRIYVMLNSAGRIKIGKTKDIYQRYQSLSNSNAGGFAIIRCLASPSTYLYTLEHIMHNKFKKYRIPNTEWFYDPLDPTGETIFNNAVNELQAIFSSADYKHSNKIRKNFYSDIKTISE